MQEISLNNNQNVFGLSEVKGINLCENLEFWMTRLPVVLRNVPIIHLAIPGSHNTTTYTIERFNDVGADESAVIQFLGRYFPIISKPIIFNWSVTQYDTVKEQLNGGIRYLDLRLATKPNSDSIYFLHGLYGSEVSEPLDQVEKWLSSHPNEVLILDFQHFYSFTEVNHQHLIAKIRNIFRSKLCPVYNRLDHISLQWLASESYQVFVIYRNIIAKNYTDLWPSGLWPTPWPDTTNSEQMVEFLNEKIQSRSPNTGFVSQCLLTPDTLYVMRHICGSLHRDLATKCRLASLPWINGNKPGPGGMNIVITDFVSYSDFLFPKTVIQRNATLLEGRTNSRDYVGYYSKGARG